MRNVQKWLLAFILAFLLIGLVKGDFRETRMSGSRLCLSCIGLYK